MKVLMISTDRRIFDENSEVKQRIIEYGHLVEELHIIVFSKKGFKNQNLESTYLYPTNSLSRWFYVWDTIRIGKRIKNINLITAQDPFETGLAGYKLSKKLETPLQLQVHTDFLSPYFVQYSMLNRLRVRIAKFLIPRASCIRVVSNRIKKSLVASGYSLKSIIVLPVFVDVEKIKNTQITEDLHQKYPQFDFIILMASRLTKEKKIVLAIDAMAEVVKKYPKAGLIIVGEGPEKKNLKINGNIIIEGWKDNLVSYYKTANLFILTSDYEGYGRTLISVAAAGCNIISSNVGIADEIIDKDNIFEPRNKDALKEKIIKAINGEIKPLKQLKPQTKEQYLEEYKKSWKKCG